MNIKYRIKNITQRIRQYLTKWFPNYMKNQYFAEVEACMMANPKKITHLENEIAFLGELIPQNAIALDVGANRGDYVFVLENSQKCAAIHAFEPIPELNQQLHNLFPNIKVHALAISDKAGKSVFKIPYIQERYFDTRGTLEDFEEQGQTGTRNIEVNITTLDEFCEKQQLSKVDFIKIDIEGHEFSAIKGATTTLAKKRPICMIEIEQRHHAHIAIQEIIEFVEKWDYMTYFFEGKSKQFFPFSQFSLAIHQSTTHFNDKTQYVNNFLFIPNEQKEHYAELFHKIEQQYR